MGASTKLFASVRDLETYRLSFELQQSVFSATTKWPKGEAYALTDQIRRSSRSIAANISEAWAKRRYPAHFLSKLTDAHGELVETLHWLATAKSCGYLEAGAAERLETGYVTLEGKLHGMMAKHEWFCAR